MSQSSKINGKWQMENGKYSWPANFTFQIVRPNYLWTQLGLALETWRNPVDLLFVPAHTLPILRKRNIGFSIFQVPFSNYLKIFQLKNRKSMANGKWQMANRPKYVVTIHDLGVEYLSRYHQFPQRYYLDLASKYAAKHADALIAVSSATKHDLISRYKVGAKRVLVVPEGVDGRFFKPQSRVKVESVKSKYKIRGDYVLFVGTVQPRKNLVTLIEAFSLLVGSRELVVSRRKKTTNYALQTTNLVIAGKLGWDYQKILDAPKKFGIKGRVKFLGHVPSEDLPSLYTGASVLTAPSLFEGFDLPILEALACGCSVIASDIAVHREIYNKIFHFPPPNFRLLDNSSIEKLKINDRWPMANGKLGHPVPITLVKPKDTDKWSRVLYQYISEYEKRKTLASVRRQLVSKFSWDETAKKTLEVFEQILR